MCVTADTCGVTREGANVSNTGNEAETGSLLVTGFERFGCHAVNSSEAVVQALPPGRELRTAVLPVAFRRAASQLQQLLDDSPLRAVLLLGLHSGSEIRLERLARNRDEADAADEDGEARTQQAIAASGPAHYPSTLPLGDLARELSSRSLPWAWSDDAGGFLCNHVFYRARAWVEQAGLPIPCGFVHLPPLECLPLARQIEAVTACLDVLGAG
jgi:pyroglutamyl-peptidase